MRISILTLGFKGLMSVSQQRLRLQPFFFLDLLAKLSYSDSQGFFDPRTLLGLKAPNTRPNRDIFIFGFSHLRVKAKRILYPKCSGLFITNPEKTSSVNSSEIVGLHLHAMKGEYCYQY